MKNEALLHEEIEAGFKKLSELEKGSDEYKTLADSLGKLIDRAVDIDRLNYEHDDKQKQFEEDKKDRWIKNGVAIFTAVSGVLVTCYWSGRSLKFEEFGTNTTSVGKSFVNKAINFFGKK